MAPKKTRKAVKKIKDLQTKTLTRKQARGVQGGQKHIHIAGVKF